MADPTCNDCPAKKRVEHYALPNPEGDLVYVARCQECGNQTVNGDPAHSPAATKVFEETVNGGQRVIRKAKPGPRVIGPPVGAVALSPDE
jgi:cytochrome c5